MFWDQLKLGCRKLNFPDATLSPSCNLHSVFSLSNLIKAALGRTSKKWTGWKRLADIFTSTDSIEQLSPCLQITMLDKLGGLFLKLNWKVDLYKCQIAMAIMHSNRFFLKHQVKHLSTELFSFSYVSCRVSFHHIPRTLARCSQITIFLNQNGIATHVHLKIFRVWALLESTRTLLKFW